MARRKPPAEPVVTYYDSGAALSVSLKYPFRFGDVWVETVSLVPPTLDQMAEIREAAPLTAHVILSPMSGLSESIIGAMRWPDVEAMLDVAFTLLPPDFVQAFKGEPEPATPEPATPDEPVDLAPPSEDPGSMSDFLVDPSEFGLNG